MELGKPRKNVDMSAASSRGASKRRLKEDSGTIATLEATNDTLQATNATLMATNAAQAATIAALREELRLVGQTSQEEAAPVVKSHVAAFRPHDDENRRSAKTSSAAAATKAVPASKSAHVSLASDPKGSWCDGCNRFSFQCYLQPPSFFLEF